MRANIKRRQRMRRVTIISVAAVIIVLVIVAAYALSTLNNNGSSLIGKPVSSAVYQPLYRLAQSSYTTSLTPSSFATQPQKGTGAEYLSGGKPIIVYIGGEFCPYCAFQRWALVVALDRFGNFTNLRYMQSSSTDVYANTATFTFVGSSYSSKYVVFQSFEQEDRAQNQLQTVPSNYSQVFTGNYPFISLGNKYIISTLFAPNLMTGLNWTQVVSLLGQNSQLRDQVVAAANEFTSIICNLTGGTPSSVCGNPGLSSFTSTLAAYYSPPSTTLKTGIPNSSASEWANVQYGQMAFRTKSSMNTR